MNNKIGFDSLKLKQLINSEYTIIALLFLIIIVATPFVNNFMTIRNFSNILTRTVIVAMGAIGMTYVIISGGIDLSINGVILISSYIGVETLMNHFGMNLYLATLCILGIGGIVGCLSGFSVVVLNMPPFIATLSMLYITKGLAFFIYKAKTVYDLPKAWSIFGEGKLFGFPIAIIIFLIFYMIANYILKYTLFGRHIYAVGSNAKAAWLAGVNTRRTVFLAYVMSGITAAGAGIILTSRVFSVAVSLGTGIELDIISAVIIGGTSFFGGIGTLLGSVIGAIIIETLGNILVLSRVSPFFILVAKGMILWLAVLLDMVRKGYAFKRLGD